MSGTFTVMGEKKVQAGDKIALLENQTVSLAQERCDQELQIARIQYEKLQARAEEATLEYKNQPPPCYL